MGHRKSISYVFNVGDSNQMCGHPFSITALHKTIMIITKKLCAYLTGIGRLEDKNTGLRGSPGRDKLFKKLSNLMPTQWIYTCFCYWCQLCVL